MGVRYNERTGVWDFDSVRDAKEWRADSGTRPMPQPQEPKGRVEGTNNGFEGLAQKVLPVLNALAESGKKGMLGEQIAPLAGLKGPKGMSGFAANVVNYLRKVTKREKVDDLFWKIRTPGTPAVWYVDASKLRSLGVPLNQGGAGG